MENDGNNQLNREYEDDYQLCMDIDWFFKYKDVHFHVASNGHKLPQSVKIGDNVKLQVITEHMIHDRRRRKYTIVTRPKPLGLNYGTFEDFARCGFVSLDTIDDTSDSKVLQVIARPTDYRNLHLKIDLGTLNILGEHIRIYDIDGTPLLLE